MSVVRYHRDGRLRNAIPSPYPQLCGCYLREIAMRWWTHQPDRQVSLLNHRHSQERFKPSHLIFCTEVRTIPNVIDYGELLHETYIMFSVISSNMEEPYWKKYRRKNIERCRENQRTRYHANPSKDIERVSKNRQRIKDWFADYKLKIVCPICGESSPECFDFHHIDPIQKSFNIGNTVKWTSISALKKELEKCIVLCANCHRKLHSGRIVYEQIQQTTEDKNFND